MRTPGVAAIRQTSLGFAATTRPRTGARTFGFSCIEETAQAIPDRTRSGVDNIHSALKDDCEHTEDILNHCCCPWNQLIDMPWKIMSIGLRNWALRF
jgi:hypothetical protein